jgi:K+-sensing histidine kinase KdpD
MDTRRARFQPWLLLGAAGAVLPLALERGAPAWVVVYLAGCAIGSAAVWVRDRRSPLTSAQRDDVALALTLVALFGLVLVLWVDDGQRPEDLLLLATAFVCAVAATPMTWLRWTFQGVVLLAVLVTMLQADRPVPDALFAVVLVLAAAALVDLFARALVDTRRSTLQARRDAATRAELLDAVRRLPGRSVEEAARAATETLVALGFDGAVVARAEDGLLVPLDVRGVPSLGPMPRGFGRAWEAIEQDSTVVHSALDRDLLLTRETGVRSVVVAPLRVDGEPVGTVAGLCRAPQRPRDPLVDSVEVLAAHLGGVMAAEARVARQAELLERMAALDRMRRGLVNAVSAEVRDPLTVVRGVSQVLSSHGDRLADERRERFLHQLVEQADSLRATIETLLDFSRSRSRRDDPRVRPVPVTELLEPLAGSGAVRVTPRLELLAHERVIALLDPALVRSALELLVGVGGGHGAGDVVTVEVRTAPDEVCLHLAEGGSASISELVASLVTQLCVAGNAVVDHGSATTVTLPRWHPPAEQIGSSAPGSGGTA